MSVFKTEYWGYPLEIEYEYTAGDKGDYYTPPTPECVEILDWRFESEEALEELNLYDVKTCRSFEDEMCEKIAEMERSRTEKDKHLRPYLRAKRRRRELAHTV